MTFNNDCAAYCIALIRAVMQETEIPPVPENVTLEHLYEFARLHSVEALMYYGLCELEMDFSDPIWLHWENRISMLLAQGVVQLTDRDHLFDTLTAAGIPLLPFKGCWMKELYPNVEYRQMSDLDMLIPRDRAQDAKRIMLENGFQAEPFDDLSYHAGYLKPPYTEVELHIALLEEDNGYYDDVWNKAVPVEGYPCLYRFTAEDEYIYYILHLNKHLEEGGSGIRSVLDSVVYRDVFPDLDRHYLQQELQKLNLWQRTLDIETIADCWFKTGEAVPEHLLSMADFMISAGTYGNMDNMFRSRLEKLEDKYKNPVLRGVMYCVLRFCRPLEEMQQSYPVLNKAPFLLPFFWIYRAVMKLVKHPKRMLDSVKIIFGRRKDHV